VNRFPGEGVDSTQYRDVMTHWASGVTVVAVREEGRVIATTVTAFLSLSLDPPRVLVSLGPNATVRPFLLPQRDVGISILHSGQKRLANVFADSFPVGPDPFTTDSAPVIDDALVRLHCTVSNVVESGTHILVIADVITAEARDGEPLLRHQGRYR